MNSKDSPLQTVLSIGIEDGITKLSNEALNDKLKEFGFDLGVNIFFSFANQLIKRCEDKPIKEKLFRNEFELKTALILLSYFECPTPLKKEIAHYVLKTRVMLLNGNSLKDLKSFYFSKSLIGCPPKDSENFQILNLIYARRSKGKTLTSVYEAISLDTKRPYGTIESIWKDRKSKFPEYVKAIEEAIEKRKPQNS